MMVMKDNYSAHLLDAEFWVFCLFGCVLLARVRSILKCQTEILWLGQNLNVKMSIQQIRVSYNYLIHSSMEPLFHDEVIIFMPC